MVYTELSSSCIIALIVSSSLASFILAKARKSHSRTLLFFLSFNLVLIVLLPLFLIGITSVNSATIEKVLFTSLTYYFCLSVSYLLFPAITERFWIPATSLCLVLATLQYFLASIYIANPELGYALFAYLLMDDLSAATYFGLLIVTLVAFHKHLRPRLQNLFDSRHLSNIYGCADPAKNADPDNASSQETKILSSNSRKRPLKKAVKLLREGRYRSCVESCDGGIQQIIVSKLLKSHPDALDDPMTLEEQLANLESDGMCVRGSDIIRLRRLRNKFARNSEDATPDEAEWALKVLRTTIKAANLHADRLRRSVPVVESSHDSTQR